MGKEDTVEGLRATFENNICVVPFEGMLEVLYIFGSSFCSDGAVVRIVMLTC